MPTGYTVAVQDGKVTEFRDYALSCARAMGALIMMRDEPFDAPIPDEFKPSDYHTKALVEAEQRLAVLLAMNPEEVDRASRDAQTKTIQEHNARNAKKETTRHRYEAMLAKVMTWQPPSPEHEPFKDFMASQLRDSIDWDCKLNDPPALLTSRDWHARAVDSTRRDIKYHREKMVEEEQRAAERTLWVRQLKESLQGV